MIYGWLRNKGLKMHFKIVNNLCFFRRLLQLLIEFLKLKSGLAVFHISNKNNYYKLWLMKVIPVQIHIIRFIMMTCHLCYKWIRVYDLFSHIFFWAQQHIFFLTWIYRLRTIYFSFVKAWLKMYMIWVCVWRLF